MYLKPSTCKNCNSKNIKISSQYPSMYFCKNCSHGEEMSIAYETPQELLNAATEVITSKIKNKQKDKLSEKDLVLIEELISTYNLTQEEVDALDLDDFISLVLKKI